MKKQTEGIPVAYLSTHEIVLVVSLAVCSLSLIYRCPIKVSDYPCLELGIATSILNDCHTSVSIAQIIAIPRGFLRGILQNK